MDIKNKYTHVLNQITEKGMTLTQKTIPFKNGELTIICFKEIIDIISLSELIVKPIMISLKDEVEIKAKSLTENIIFVYDCHLENDASKIQENLLNGQVLILLSNDENYIVANLKKFETRAITTPEIAYTIRGPRDCFVENIESNLSLVRHRIKDPNLKIEMLKVGKRSNTDVAVIYVQDIANPNSVNTIIDRLKRINVDAIWGTGEIQAFLQNKSTDLFPIMTSTERSDWACEAVMEGKVLVIVDGGQMGIFGPRTYSESINACDDRYDNVFFGLFSRLIRYLALFITLCLSSIYIAVVSFHTDVLPAQFAIALSQMRKEVLFSAIFEVLIIEFIGELIRESLLRVPSKIGTAVGIVGAIVIGQAATSAGLFSPLILIIAAASLMSSFAIPDYFSAHPIRILKFLIIILTGFFGLYGFVIGITIILLNLVSIDSFGVPYMAPFAPFNFYDFIRQFIFNARISPKRQQFLKDIDDTRTNKLNIK